MKMNTNFVLLSQSVLDKLYGDIKNFRRLFDLPVEMPRAITSKEDGLHTALAVEELKELALANTHIDRLDAIVDTIYVMMGRAVQEGWISLRDNPGFYHAIDLLLQVGQSFDYDVLAAWDIIHQSNMSKVCDTIEIAELTYEHYQAMGIDTRIEWSEHGNKYLIKVAKEYTDDKDNLVRVGKVLKSVHYTPADLTPLFKD